MISRNHKGCDNVFPAIDIFKHMNIMGEVDFEGNRRLVHSGMLANTSRNVKTMQEN
jgi:hypothetical protein